MMTEFTEFPKIARLSRDIIVSEKIDGTNAQVYIEPLPTEHGLCAGGITNCVAVVGNLAIFAGSRSRWITPDSDNFGFAAWVRDHAEELALLGPGRHFGEWWGSGIQRGYGLPKGEKRFSLFNVQRWHLAGHEPHETKSLDPRQPSKFSQELPPCCGLVPVLAVAEFSTHIIESCLTDLATSGSRAAPGFMRPEGVVVYHTAANTGFKKTLEKDGQPKSQTGG